MKPNCFTFLDAACYFGEVYGEGQVWATDIRQMKGHATEHHHAPLRMSLEPILEQSTYMQVPRHYVSWGSLDSGSDRCNSLDKCDLCVAGKTVQLFNLVCS